MGLDTTREFPILQDTEIDIRPGDICYMIGDSSGGKSTLLKLLAQRVKEAGVYGKVVDLNKIEISEDEIIIENAGSSFEEALKNLSIAGLNGALLMIRKFKELPDGQRYPYKIAKMLSQDSAKVWICDEFLSTIDRDTAKVVAYCLQNKARRLKRAVTQELAMKVAPGQGRAG